MVFTTQGQSPVYSDMSIALFTNCYLAVVAEEAVEIKAYMLVHLQQLMEDVEVYEWKIVREYHAAWLQLLEQGRAAWGDAAKKDKLQRLLVWGKTALGTRLPAPNGAPTCQPTPTAQDYRSRYGYSSQASVTRRALSTNEAPAQIKPHIHRSYMCLYIVYIQHSNCASTHKPL